MSDKEMVRSASADDAEAIKTVEILSGLSAWTIEDYEKLISDPHAFVFVAPRSQRILGFLTARLITNSNSSQSTDATREVEILNLAVLERFRKQGLGNALLKKLFQALYEFRPFTVFLEVRASNSDAINFYRDNGFLKTGVRANYYQKPPEDAILMTFEANFEPGQFRQTGNSDLLA